MASRQSGFILIYTLWVLTGISLVVAAYSTKNPVNLTTYQLQESLEYAELRELLGHITRFSVVQSVNVDERLVLHEEEQKEIRQASADERVEFLKSLLGQMGMELNIDAPTPDVAVTSETEEKTETVQTEIPAGMRETRLEPVYFPSKDGWQVVLGDREYLVSIDPVNERLNLNLLSEEALMRYFRDILSFTDEQAQTVAARIADWRDEDSLVRQYGAEASDYINRSDDVTPANREINSWRELSYLFDADPYLLELLQQHFNLFGGRHIYWDKLEAPALAALADVSMDVAERFLTNRRLAPEDVKPDDQVLLSEDVSRIGKVVSFQKDYSFWRISLQGKAVRLAAVFDTDRLKVHDLKRF